MSVPTTGNSCPAEKPLPDWRRRLQPNTSKPHPPPLPHPPPSPWSVSHYKIKQFTLHRVHTKANRRRQMRKTKKVWGDFPVSGGCISWMMPPGSWQRKAQLGLITRSLDLIAVPEREAVKGDQDQCHRGPPSGRSRGWQSRSSPLLNHPVRFLTSDGKNPTIQWGHQESIFFIYLFNKIKKKMSWKKETNCLYFRHYRLNMRQHSLAKKLGVDLRSSSAQLKPSWVYR